MCSTKETCWQRNRTMSGNKRSANTKRYWKAAQFKIKECEHEHVYYCQGYSIRYDIPEEQRPVRLRRVADLSIKTRISKVAEEQRNLVFDLSKRARMEALNIRIISICFKRPFFNIYLMFSIMGPLFSVRLRPLNLPRLRSYDAEQSRITEKLWGFTNIFCSALVISDSGLWMGYGDDFGCLWAGSRIWTIAWGVGETPSFSKHVDLTTLGLRRQLLISAEVKYGCLDAARNCFDPK